MARGPAVKIILGDSERSELEMRARRRKIARVDAVRAEIVLLAAEGMNNCAIAATLGLSRLTAGLWRKRFVKKRFDGLDDEPRCGAPRKIGDEKIAEVVTKTLETMPADATHWSTRSMARTSGVSISTVHRIWNAFSLAPHRSETFKLSSDPQFVEKVRDIVGLYLDRRSGLWCSVSMKRARSRRWTAPNRCCHCGLVRSSGAPTTTNATARRRCSLRSM